MPRTTPPSLITSLYQSCNSTEFYSTIPSIPFWRSLLLLFISSLISSIALLLLISHSVFSNPNLTTEILHIYDKKIPTFEGAYSDGILEMDPHQISLTLSILPNYQLQISEKSPDQVLMKYHLSVDTLRSIEEPIPSPSPGILFARNGIIISSGVTEDQTPFEDFDIASPLVFNKESVHQMLEIAMPELLPSLEHFLILFGPIALTFYLFFSGLLQAIIFSVFGSLSLLIRGISFSYWDTIKLAFYANVPALLILILTLALGISVSFLPLLIQVLFYFIGLRQLGKSHHGLA